MGTDVYIRGVEQRINNEWVDIAVKGCIGYLGRRCVYNFLNDYLTKENIDDGSYLYSITLNKLSKLETNFRSIEEVEENMLITNSRLALCYHYLTCLVDDSSDIGQDALINERDLRLLIEIN